MTEKMLYWIGGTITGLLGVGLVRLLAPALAGGASSLASVAGYLLVIAGIMVLARATKRKASPVFLAMEKEAKD
jgi:uncharacterized membrane protein YuzA (DUF378 family)